MARISISYWIVLLVWALNSDSSPIYFAFRLVWLRTGLCFSQNDQINLCEHIRKNPKLWVMTECLECHNLDLVQFISIFHTLMRTHLLSAHHCRTRPDKRSCGRNWALVYVCASLIISETQSVDFGKPIQVSLRFLRVFVCVRFTSFVGRDDHKTLGSGGRSLWGEKAVPARACLQEVECQAWTSEAPSPEFPKRQKAEVLFNLYSENSFVKESFSFGLKCEHGWEKETGWMSLNERKREKSTCFYKKTLRSTRVTPFPHVRDFLCHEWVLLCNGVQREILDWMEPGPTGGGK